MRNNTYRIPLLTILSALTAVLASGNLFGQDNKQKQDEQLKKEVQVVRPYEPSISDAFKINLQPKVEDTLKIAPNFSYSILQRPLITSFSVTPISAARMLQEQPLPLHSTYLKMGYGNYKSPLLELYFNKKRSTDYAFGAWVQHRSSFGDIELANSDKVNAGYGRTDVLFFGKRMMKNSVLAAQAGYNNHKVTYYGYNTANGSVTPNSDIQKFDRIDANISYYSTHTDSTHLNYKFAAAFNHIGDEFNMQENRISTSLYMDKFKNTERFGGDLTVNHYLRNQSLDSANNTTISIAPWINLFGKQWRVMAGVKYIYESNRKGGQTYLYPCGMLSYDIISHYFIPYFEIGGYLEENSYNRITAENPWVIKGLDVWNTSHKMILTGGIKGNFSAKLSYNLLASYSLIDSMYFFVNASENVANPLMNRFTVDFDNIRQTKVLGEITFAPSERINLLLHAEYFYYKTTNMAKPWHKPDYYAFAAIRYNIRDKILLKAELYALGNRYVAPISGPDPILLDGYLDLNLGIEYRYNKRLSAFVNGNNLTAAKAQLWYLYPMHRFNMNAGLTYAF